MNRIVRTAALSVSRATSRFLLRIPPLRHAVVHGWPDDEGNSVEIVRALRRRYRGTVYWLLSDPAWAGPDHAAAELADTARIVRVRKNSLRSYYVALTAETTFFTHGLFTAVDPPASRLVVNLWHGDGPKVVRDTHPIRSTVAVAGTALWGGQRARRFRLPAGNVAVLGNPRIDQFTISSRVEVLRRLGLDPERLTILWLPTYRAASAPHGRTWHDGGNLSDRADTAEFVHTLREAAETHAVQLVVKPHPLDADVYSRFDITVLPHRRLAEAGLTLYQLLGAADAIISDISSVWADFLTLDRPVGFYVPDLEELQRRRGLNVSDLTSLLPGPRIETPTDARRFVETVATDPGSIRPSNYPGSERIGAAKGGRVADRLLDWLDDFQQARNRQRLFTRRDLEAVYLRVPS